MSSLEDYYRGINHDELYRQLHEGDSGQVDALAARWQSFADTADALASGLADDLRKVAVGWVGPASSEFQRRVGLMVALVENVYQDAVATKQYLSTSAGYLRNALGKAEPASNPHHQRDATILGGVVGGIVGGVIGNELGHQQDEEEKDKAHERIVKLVAGVANDYLNTRSGLIEVPPAPEGLPGDGTSNAGAGDGGAAAAKAAAYVGSTNAASRLAGNGTETLKGVSSVPHLTGGGATGASDGISSVAAPGVVGPGGGGTSSTTDKKSREDQESGLLGAGAAAMTTAAFGMSAGLGAASGASFSGGGGGSVGSGGAGGAFGGLSGASYGTEGIRSNGLISNQSNSASVGRGPNVVQTDEAAKNAAKSPAKSGNSGGNVLGRGLGVEEGEAEERITWLTEDDRVWDDDRDIAPGVLGGSLLTPASEE